MEPMSFDKMYLWKHFSHVLCTHVIVTYVTWNVLFHPMLQSHLVNNNSSYSSKHVKLWQNCVATKNNWGPSEARAWFNRQVYKISYTSRTGLGRMSCLLAHSITKTYNSVQWYHLTRWRNTIIDSVYRPDS